MFPTYLLARLNATAGLLTLAMENYNANNDFNDYADPNYFFNGLQDQSGYGEGQNDPMYNALMDDTDMSFMNDPYYELCYRHDALESQYPEPEASSYTYGPNPNLASVPKGPAPPASKWLSPPATRASASQAAIPSPPQAGGAASSNTYRNPILSQFIDCPSIALRVLDRFVLIDKELEAELVKELEQHKAQGQASAFLPSPINTATRPQALQVAPAGPENLAWPSTATPKRRSSSVVIRRRKVLGNKRPENISKFQSSSYYQPLPHAPLTWGKIDPSTLEPSFRYTQHGELLPTSKFETQQIMDYISGHPLHHTSGIFDPKHSGLTIWIQTVPADSGSRYATKNSDKCRFLQCPDPLRTIRKGDFRVAFDENFAMAGSKYDLYHVAGYVHLSCLERFVNFPQLCKDYNVLPDTRIFPEGKNKMAVTRDHPEMAEVVMDFIRDSVPWNNEGNQRPRDYYNQTLNYRLTLEHLNRQASHLASIRDERGGNHIGIHLNNLELWVALQRKTKEDRAKKRKGGGTPEPLSTKRRRTENDSSSVLDESWMQGGSGELSPRAIRAAKRAHKH